MFKKTFTFNNGKPYKETFYDSQHRYHRIDGPAYIRYDQEGNIIQSEWMINGRQLEEHEIPKDQAGIVALKLMYG